ncbi:MAG: 23S rRNA (pseudouridine(1915)-N(3))-methyltransferase RlmH [Clostridia bacterium]|nr:23S rRNA (pseudouridine(1915)-N(3))-methyltransferase RlmH [Clostridia bacterium]
MLSINLICVGNLKEKFWRESQDEFTKRLSAFCKLNIIEIKEQNYLENIDLIIQKESETILKNLKGYTILFDVKGKTCTSEDFSLKIDKLTNVSSEITFIIGGSYGVNDEIKNKVNERLSFSSMTFPHNLFRVMALEQIYRAFMIKSGKSYHK